jgi:hypothetical protein
MLIDGLRAGGAIGEPLAEGGLDTPQLLPLVERLLVELPGVGERGENGGQDDLLVLVVGHLAHAHEPAGRIKPTTQKIVRERNRRCPSHNTHAPDGEGDAGVDLADVLELVDEIDHVIEHELVVLAPGLGARVLELEDGTAEGHDLLGPDDVHDLRDVVHDDREELTDESGGDGDPLRVGRMFDQAALAREHGMREEGDIAPDVSGLGCEMPIGAIEDGRGRPERLHHGPEVAQLAPRVLNEEDTGIENPDGLDQAQNEGISLESLRSLGSHRTRRTVMASRQHRPGLTGGTGPDDIGLAIHREELAEVPLHKVHKERGLEGGADVHRDHIPPQFPRHLANRAGAREELQDQHDLTEANSGVCQEATWPADRDDAPFQKN